MLTPTQYSELSAKIFTYELWRHGRRVLSMADLASAPVQVTNEERSAVEVYEFAHSAPERYFAYIKRLGIGGPREVTTWMGDLLGIIVHSGSPFKSNMGDTRQNIRVRAINGRTYSGTYYSSSGDYCRLKLIPLSQLRVNGSRLLRIRTLT